MNNVGDLHIIFLEHGGWSLWGSWTKCPVTCGTGVRERTRTCDSPRALYGGRPCEGLGEETQECDAGRPCPSMKQIFILINTVDIAPLKYIAL